METQKSKRINYAYSMSDDDFKDIIETSRSWMMVLQRCGYHNVGNATTVKKRSEQLGLNVSHINGNAPENRTERPHKRSDENIFVENSTYEDRSQLKKRLIKNYGYEHKCNGCGLTEWRGKPIPIELEHKNGVNNDHRVENLEFLCCNCHAQTDTYRGKNRHVEKFEKLTTYSECVTCHAQVHKVSMQCKKCQDKAARKVKDRPSYDQLLEDKKTMTWLAMGQKYGVCDNTIRKWMRAYAAQNQTEDPQ